MSKIPQNTQRAIDKFVSKMDNILNNSIEKIILYGSYARGDYNKSSDVDIMILTNLTNKEIEECREKISDVVFEIQVEEDIYISPSIKNIDNYNVRVKFVPFYMNVKKEGVELYG